MLGSQQLSAKDGTQHQALRLSPHYPTRDDWDAEILQNLIYKELGGGGCSEGSGEGYCLKDV